MSPTNLLPIVQSLCIVSDPRLQRGFSDLLHSLISTKSCLLSEWARLSLNFDAFIKKVSRLFRNKSCSWKLENKILAWLLPRFEKKKYLPVLIDPSFVPNRYLGTPAKTRSDQTEAKKGFFLFSASLPVKGRAISFFHAVYRYTQIGYQVHKSLNTLLGAQLFKLSLLLKDSLSKAVFIMDRGFGYEFFLKKMKELKTHYVIRARDLSTHVISTRFKVLYKGTTPTYLVITKKIIYNKLHVWVLLTDLKEPQEVIWLYQQRMKIEEAFKDWKSTGFNIEKLQIRQWDVLPKMIWAVVIAHMILYLIGETISCSKKYKNYFKQFIQIKKNLSFVQLAWKAWLYDQPALPELLSLLFSSLTHVRRAL